MQSVVPCKYVSNKCGGEGREAKEADGSHLRGLCWAALSSMRQCVEGDELTVKECRQMVDVIRHAF